MKLTIEQKQAFINENLEQFFNSPKTSSEEYKVNFNSMDVEKQYAVVLRWKKYNEKKTNGETTKRASTRSSSLNRVDLLMQGIEVDMTNDEALELQEKFKKAIETCETIIENNKIRKFSGTQFSSIHESHSQRRGEGAAIHGVFKIHSKTKSFSQDMVKNPFFNHLVSHNIIGD